MRQVNTRFFLVLLATLAAGAAALFGAHRLQAGNITNALLWQADQAEKNGKPAVAARYLGRYLEFAPDDVDERAHLATILSDLAVTPASRNRAMFAINQVLAWDPLRHELRQALCRLAMASFKMDVAKEHLDYLQGKLPESGNVAFLLGSWYERKLRERTTYSDTERAKLSRDIQRQYEKAIEAEPRKVEAYVQLVALLKQLDFGKESRNAAEIDRRVAQALKNAPEDAAVLGLAAQRAQEKGDAAAALKHLEKGLEKNPTEPSLYQALARVHGQQGNRREAIAQLKKGLEMVAKQHQAELTWTLANLLLDDEQMDAARKVIVQIRDVNQLSADYLEARCLMLQGRWADAAPKLEKLRPAFTSVPELSLQTDMFLGQCYGKIDEPVRQMTAFQHAVKIDPTSVAARYGVAMAHWALGQRDEALAQLLKLIQANTNRAEAARWRFEYASMLLQMDVRRDPALKATIGAELDAAEKDLPGAIECALLRAELLFGEGQPEKAAIVLNKAVERDPKKFEGWIALATLAMATKQPLRAEEILTAADKHVAASADFDVAKIQFASRHRLDRRAALSAMENDRTRFDAHAQARLLAALAQAHFHAGRPAESMRLLRLLAALPLDLEDIRVRMQLLSLALAQDDEPEMVRVLAEIKKIEGEPATEYSYGEALRLIWRARRGETDALDKAHALLNIADIRRPDWPALLIARGDAYELQGNKVDQAVVSYRKAIEVGSRDPQALFKLVMVLEKAHRLDEVELELRRMSQFGLDLQVGKQLIGLWYARRDYREAMKIGEKLLRPESKDFRDQLMLGQLLLAGGRTSPEVEAAFRRAVALGERQPEAWVGLVRYLSATGQFTKALEEIDNAAKKLEANVKLQALASCYEVLGALDEAERVYQQALAEQPKSARVRRNAAEFFLRAGKPHQAEPHYRLLLEGKLATADNDIAAARRGLALVVARSGDLRRVSEALQLVDLVLDANGKVDQTTVGKSLEARLAQARVLGAVSSHTLRGHAIELLDALNKKQVLPAEDQYQLALLLHLHSPDAATWKKSRDILSAITKSQPNNARYIAYHANLLLMHKEVPDAEALIARLEQFEKDRKLPAGAMGSIELKVRALELRGKELQAVALMSDFANQKDAPPARALVLAGLHGRLGNYQEAVDLCYQVKLKGYRDEAYTSALGILRAGKPAAGQAAKLQRWQQQIVRMEGYLRAGIKADEGNLVLRLQLADLMDLQGRFDQVEAICRAIFPKDADNLVALNNLAWLLARKEGKAQESLELIQRAIRRHGARPELLDTRAVAYLALGQSREAILDLEQVVRDAPTPTRYFHLTRAHHLAKNAPLALAALRQANQLGLSAQALDVNDQEAYREIEKELQPKQ
jgi:tetratricopeptide (TPR) repeat protein